MHTKILQQYQDNIHQHRDRLSQLSKRTNVLSTLRIIAFLSALLCLIFFLSTEGEIIYMIVSVVSFVTFMILVKRFDAVKRQRDFTANIIRINEDEIKAKAYDFAHLDDGAEFLEEEHPYLHDLDIFGPASIFQYLNRTSTRMGKKILASWFASPSLDPAVLQKRQEAVSELSPKLDWRQSMQANGMSIQEEDNEITSLENWVKQAPIFLDKAWVKVFRFVSPAIVMIVGLCSLLNLIPNSYFLMAVATQVLIYVPFVKRVQQLHQSISNNLGILIKFMSMIELVEQENFASELMVQYQNHFKKSTASKSLMILTQRVELFNQRSNIVVGGIFNLLILWDIQTVISIEQWLSIHKGHVQQWLQDLAQIDALNSLANFQYNHPNYAFPTLNDKDFELEAKGLGHPLIHRDKLVKSDFAIDDLGKFYLVTGSNMAGKSTFLRAIGVNLVLGMMGTVVCAASMHLVPIKLFSSMRTTDSLKDSESYFYAELKRLKSIIQQLKSGQKMFVILDEILKGTNSDDKLAGSKAFIEQLIGLPAVGLLATHDLELAKLEQQYPSKVHNYCFEMQIQDDELSFSYQLQRGICSSFNATFLMKKMEIIP